MERKPPYFDFIERDPESPDVFFVDHPELGGRRRFRIKKQTFGLRRILEQVRANEVNSLTPTEDGARYADYFATILVGLESSPFTAEDGKAPDLALDDISDLELIMAIWSEVWAYWSSFRGPKQA